MANETAPEINPEKKSSLKYIIVAIVALIIITVVVYFIFSRPKSNSDIINSSEPNQTNLSINTVSINTTVNQNVNAASVAGKVLGASNGKLPYAAVDAAHTVSRVIGPNGGVVTAALSKNVTAYYVIPADEVIQSATISLIPYAAMPTGANHGYVSDELGYGLQVEVKSSQTGVGGYLVFDTTGGQATASAEAKEKYFNRCDPRFAWFDPYLCGRKNGVTGTQVVTKDTTVVTPIHNANNNSLLFPQNTIPTGIDGLTAIKVKGGDVFIPQRVDAALAAKLFADTMSDKASRTQRLEAAGLAFAWDINSWKPNQLEALQTADGQSYQEITKYLYLLKHAKDLLSAGQMTVVRTSSDDQTDSEIADDLNDNLQNAAEDFFKDIIDVTKSFGFGIDSVEAVAAGEAAEEAGIPGASEASSTVGNNIDNTINTPDTSAHGADNQAGALEGSSYSNNDDFDPEVSDMQQKAQGIIDGILSNPNASIAELLYAAQLAQMAGLDNWEDIYNQVMDRIKKILEDKVKQDGLSKQSYLDIAAQAQLFGLTDIADAALIKAGLASMTSGDCELIKKNLANYGINDCGE